MPKKRWIVLILFLVAMSLCATTALCGTASYFGRRTGGVRQLLGSWGSDPLARGPSALAQSSGPVEGTLRLSGGLPPTLDPAMVQDSTSAEYIVHLFSGLVTLNSELEIVPDLAERWELSDDGRTYTFYLLPDATFQDGKPITAHDVIASIERACDPALGSPVALTYLGDILGVPEYRARDADHIAGLNAISDHTLTIEIDAAKAYFLAKLTYPAAFVVDLEQIEQEGQSWMQQPNGSGPFVLDSISRDQIVLVRNERYYRGAPAIERVEYLLSGGFPMTMYENGELDLVGVPPSEIERVLDPYNPLHDEYQMTSELSVQYIGLNVEAPPFDDPRVRQAFAHAIDRTKIADLVLKGTAQPAVGILPPEMPGYNEGLEVPYDPSTTIQTGRHDPERARALLAESRYGSAEALPEIRLAISGTSGHMPPMTRAIVSMLEENLGIEILVEQVDWADFLQDLNDRRYQAFSTGWAADYPDPQNFLDILFYSSSEQNHTGYSSDQVDHLLEEARLETDPAQRMALYQQAEAIIIHDAPWIPLIHGVNYTLVKPYVRGYRASPGLYPWLTTVAIE